MRRPKIYGVYVARFPFLESAADKLRPVIVVSRPYGAFNVVCVIPISSKVTAEKIDVTLADWHQAQLVKPSVARVHRLTTLLQSDLQTELAPLSEHDTTELKLALRKYLQLQTTP